MHFSTPLVEALRGAQHIAVLTGAGMSAESGVPTFRDAQTGLWSRFKPEELATPEAFLNNPKLVWDWYAWRRELVEKVQPHAKAGEVLPALVSAVWKQQKNLTGL